jgi:hypothetical protein
VERLVIDVGADRVDVLAFKVAGLAEMLLFIQNVMLRASNDTSILNTSNGVGNCNAGEIRVRREAFPVTLS